MHKSWIRSIAYIWIYLASLTQATDSVPETGSVLDSSGLPQSRLNSSTETISDQNLTLYPDDNETQTDFPSLSLELNAGDNFTEFDTSVEISVIWMDYLESIGAYNREPIDPLMHRHYEVVSTSSKSNLCRIQCLALCYSNNLKVDCIAGCQKFRTDEWMFDCLSIDCVQTCSHLDNITGGLYPSPRPPVVRMTQDDPHKLELSWTNSVVEFIDPEAVIYYVIENVELKGGIPTGNWTYVRKTRSLSIVETLDVCWEGCYRVAAVSKSGSSGYANTSHVDRTDLPKPGPVSYLHKNDGAKFSDGYFYFNISWKNPKNWEKHDISDFYVMRTRYWCPHFDGLKPQTHLYYEYDKESDFYVVRNFAIHQSVWGCYFVYKITPVSKCDIEGRSVEIVFNLTDCKAFKEFACPGETKYELLTNITILNKEIIPENRSVLIQWEDPVDSDKEVVEIPLYRIQWGPISMGEVEESIILEGEQYINKTRTMIQVDYSNVTYGVKIIPLQLVDGVLLPNETLSINLYDVTVRFRIDALELPQNTDPDTSDVNTTDSLFYYVIGGAAVLIVIFIAGTVIVMRRRKGATTREKHNWRTDLLNQHIYTNVPLPKECMIDNPFYLKQPDRLGAVLDAWEMPYSALRLEETLGAGAFGQVVRATVNSSAIPTPGDGGSSPARDLQRDTTVAVKLLHEHAEDWHRQDFLKEIDMMKNIGFHPNVVSMLGCCTSTEPICLVVEHITNGDLLNYLKQHRQIILQPEEDREYPGGELTITDLYLFAQQIAIGMEFLSQKGFVHRDLATRNVLVGDNRVVKIGDFGLTRYIYDDKIYVTRKGGKLPLKWMAIEAIFDLSFTTASDVWSFGVVLFELITLGGTPYPTVANKDLLRELQTGYRMEKPDTCSALLYAVMQDCWKENPNGRPTFTELKETMGQMVEQSSDTTLLPLNINTNSEYHFNGTDTNCSSTEVDAENSVVNVPNDVNNNVKDDVIIPDGLMPYPNDGIDLNDVFNTPETNSCTTETDNDQSDDEPPVDENKVKIRRKRRRKDFKPPTRSKNQDRWRESTCSHDELLPPSPCSPSVNTNVAFVCEV